MSRLIDDLILLKVQAERDEAKITPVEHFFIKENYNKLKEVLEAFEIIKEKGLTPRELIAIKNNIVYTDYVVGEQNGDRDYDLKTEDEYNKLVKAFKEQEPVDELRKKFEETSEIGE